MRPIFSKLSEVFVRAGLLRRRAFLLRLPIGCWALCFLLYPTTADPQPPVTIGVFKGQFFTQDSPDAPRLLGFQSEFFSTTVEPFATEGAEPPLLHRPDGTAQPLSTGGGYAELFETFESRLALDETYPPGDYRIEVKEQGGDSRFVEVVVTENHYPSAPWISNFSATQAVRADADFEFQWMPLLEGTEMDLIQFTIFDRLDGSIVFATPGLGKNGRLDGLAQSGVIPANTLEHGTFYDVSLRFTRMTFATDGAGLGQEVFSGFQRETHLTMLTAGTPNLAALDFQFYRRFQFDAGDFSGFDPQPVMTLPFVVAPCAEAILQIAGDDLFPNETKILFAGPIDSGIDLEALYRFFLDDGVLYQSPCLSDVGEHWSGEWTVFYNDYPLVFERPAPDLALNPAVIKPTLEFEGAMLDRILWEYRAVDGTLLASPPDSIDQVRVELLNHSFFPMYESVDLPASTLELKLDRDVAWEEVAFLIFVVTDLWGDVYRIEYYHPRPPSIDIPNLRLPKGSEGIAYDAVLPVSGGVPPYQWSMIDGALPRGLVFDLATGSISGVPEEQGRFRPWFRVEDQRGDFLARIFTLAIGSGGPPRLVRSPRGGDVNIGDSFFIFVEADGAEPLGFQWTFDGSELPGETGPILEFKEIQLEQAGEYAVTVSNEQGGVTSEPVLTHHHPPTE